MLNEPVAEGGMEALVQQLAEGMEGEPRSDGSDPTLELAAGVLWSREACSPCLVCSWVVLMLLLVGAAQG